MASGLTSAYTDLPLHAAYTGGALLIIFWAFLMVALAWHRPPEVRA
jgi:hypothetical protein